ncbi:MAG: FtsX-like permease family protein [Candidatus Dormibacteraceae bacterium]
MTLSYLERRPGLAALRSVGWPRWAVLEVLLGQALVFGLAGGLAGALLVAAGGSLVRAPAEAVLAAAGSALLAALVATSLAVLAPLALAYHLSPSESLRGE